MLGRLFGSKPQAQGLVCPHCEKELAGHDDAGCRRRMSRRYFLGAMVAAPLAIKAVVEAPAVQAVRIELVQNPNTLAWTQWSEGAAILTIDSATQHWFNMVNAMGANARGKRLQNG